MENNPITPPQNRKQKILVIDDSIEDLELSSMVLSKTFTVITLEQPELCLETIEIEKPDLVLLDIMMPNIDGNQLLECIRSRWSQIDLPVIMVTIKSDASDVIDSLGNGANDYILKPVEFTVAIKRIQTHLEIARLSKCQARAKEVEAIATMIITYNHEINNPLAIALGHAVAIRKKTPAIENIEKLEAALLRIKEVVKKTTEIIQSGGIEYATYVGDSKILKLK